MPKMPSKQVLDIPIAGRPDDQQTDSLSSPFRFDTCTGRWMKNGQLKQFATPESVDTSFTVADFISEANGMALAGTFLSTAGTGVHNWLIGGSAASTTVRSNPTYRIVPVPGGAYTDFAGDSYSNAPSVNSFYTQGSSFGWYCASGNQRGSTGQICYLTCVDKNSGDVLDRFALNSSATTMYVVGIHAGGSAYDVCTVFWVNFTGGNYVLGASYVSGPGGTVTNVSAGINLNADFQVDFTWDGTKYYVAYADAANTSIAIEQFEPTALGGWTGTLYGPNLIAASTVAAIGLQWITQHATSLHIMYGTAAGNFYFQNGLTGANTLICALGSAADYCGGCLHGNGSTAWAIQCADRVNVVTVNGATPAAATPTAFSGTHFRLLSAPYSLNTGLSNPIFFAVTDGLGATSSPGNRQSRVFVMSDTLIGSTHYARVSGITGYGYEILCPDTNVGKSSTRFAFSSLETSVNPLVTNTTWMLRTQAEQLYAHPASMIPSGDSAYVSAGMMGVPDVLGTEAQPLMVPPTPSVSIATAGSTDTYYYVAVYRLIRGEGVFVNSAVSSFSIDATNPVGRAQSGAPIGGGNAATITFRAGVLTNNAIKIDFFRTVSNASSGIFYYVGTADANTGTTTFVDTYTDAQITGQLLSSGFSHTLYTNDGELDNVIPDSFIAETPYRGRVVGLTGAGVLWCSKDFAGGEALVFSDLLRYDLKLNKPAVMWAQGDTLYIGCANGLWALSGDPPDNFGNGAGFSNPTLVNGGLRFELEDKVYLVDGGAIFSCTSGWYMFGQQAEKISDQWFEELYGSNNKTNARFPYILSAAVVPETSEIWVNPDNSHNGGQNANTQIYVYNYQFKKWSKHPSVSARCLAAIGPHVSTAKSDLTEGMTGVYAYYSNALNLLNPAVPASYYTVTVGTEYFNIGQNPAPGRTRLAEVRVMFASAYTSATQSVTIETQGNNGSATSETVALTPSTTNTNFRVVPQYQTAGRYKITVSSQGSSTTQAPIPVAIQLIYIDKSLAHNPR